MIVKENGMNKLKITNILSRILKWIYQQNIYSLDLIMIITLKETIDNQIQRILSNENKNLFNNFIIFIQKTIKLNLT